MKHFTFFNESNNDYTLKIAAQNLREQNAELSIPESLDLISAVVNDGLTYNEAIEKSKPMSPFVVFANEADNLKYDTLFLPIELNANIHGVDQDAIYYVPVTSRWAALTRDHQIELEQHPKFIENLSWQNIERIETDTHKGWIVKLLRASDDTFIAHIEIKCTDEGVILDLWSEYRGEFIETTAADYSELFEVFSFEDVISKEGCISDYQACVELGVEEETNTTLVVAGGLELTLSGCWVVDDGTGSYITPTNLKSIGYTDADIHRFMAWLQGIYDPKFQEFSCISAPWFQITHNGNRDCEPFDTLPRNLNECLYLMSQQFIS